VVFAGADMASRFKGDGAAAGAGDGDTVFCGINSRVFDYFIDRLPGD
jgi:hypothetical protein